MRRILWVDGLGGLAVGLGMAILHPFLLGLLGWPRGVLFVVTGANLAYGSFATLVARQPTRTVRLVGTLAALNMAWAGVCAALLAVHWGTATHLGLAQFGLEGIWVGGLGVLEWINRRALAVPTGGGG